MSSLIGRISKLRRESPLAFYSVTHVLVFALIFVPLSHLFYYGPGAMELHVARQIQQGQLPYRDFQLEYPPLAVLSFVLPSLMSSQNQVYSLAFAGEMLLLDLLILWLIKILTVHLNISINRSLGVYTALLIAVGPIVVCRYDLLPAALTLAALTAFVSGWNIAAWALVALGVTAKLYPIIIAPIMGLYLLRNGQVRKIIIGGLSFIFTLLAFNLPFYLLSPGNFLSILTYHAQRGLHSESTYASGIFIGKILGQISEVKGIFDFGSWNIDTPLADRLARLSFPISAALLMIIYILFAWQLWKKPAESKERREMPAETASLLIQFATVTVIVFMISTKVFSAQYLIWLMPLLPVVDSKCYKARWLLFATTGLLTQYIFPYNYLNFESFKTLYILVIVIRNAIMLALAFILILSGRTRGKEPLVSIETLKS
jgi:uncharacterized membrane protein